MTAPTEHPRRALPAAGASDRGASSPPPGRAYRNHAEEIAAALRERDGTTVYDCGPRITPEQSARLAQMWEAPEPTRRLPSGWWVIPAAALGLAGWAGLIAAAIAAWGL